jgi:predicted metal-dependent hydrolase
MSAPKPALTRRPAPPLDFSDVPRFWFGGDPFKTRFFDALSTFFPEGEKYFIESVRAYRAEISDPALAQEVADFTYQEAQHSLAHRQFNERLKTQGIAVDRYEHVMREWMGFETRHLPRLWNIANTAAAEHLTAVMAQLFMQADVYHEADPRMRALYLWHAMEETEHKAVAFDVMQKVARAGYAMRVLPLLYETAAFPLSTLITVDDMLRADGFSRRERLRLWAGGLRWLFGKDGLMRAALPELFAYFRRDFHPWQEDAQPAYRAWRAAYEASGSALVAASARD